MDKQVILVDLRTMIDEWINKKENRNIVTLAKKSMVNETTVRRAYNQQTVPKSDNFLKMIIFLKKDSKVFNLIEKCPASISKYLKNNFPHLTQEETRDTECTFEYDDYLKDFYSYIIYKRISHRDNISRDDILSWLGELGIVKLDDLISNELVFQTERGLLIAAKKNFSISPYLLKRHSHKIIEVFFKPKDILDGGPGLLRNTSESVSEDGFNKVQNILSDTSNKINKVIQDNPGSIPLVYVGLLDTMYFSNHKIMGGK